MTKQALHPSMFKPPHGLRLSAAQFRDALARCADFLSGISKLKLQRYGFHELRLMDEDAPNSFEEVAQAMVARPYGDAFPIYHGHCEKTILHANCANTWYRAWHDVVHVEQAGSFTMPGERKVVQAQLDEMVTHGAQPEDCDVVWYDIMGGLLHFWKYDVGPEEQRAFVEACCMKGLDFALAYRW